MAHFDNYSVLYHMDRSLVNKQYQLLEKECALVLVNCLGGLPRNSVVRVTDRTQNDLKCVEGL